MAVAQGTNGNDVFYMSTMGVPVGSPGSHAYSALGGNDTVYGSAYMDIIEGGSGDDVLFGYNGIDALIGQNGNDTLYGGNGDDFLHGGSGDAGQDVLDGGAGYDDLSGGFGNDVYIHTANSGTDTINEGFSEATVPGYGGGEDILVFTGITSDQLAAYRPDNSNDLWLGSFADFADGSMDDGVIIEDFYLNDPSTFVEWVNTSDNLWIDLTQLL